MGQGSVPRSNTHPRGLVGGADGDAKAGKRNNLFTGR
jgi:hypothetical protein